MVNSSKVTAFVNALTSKFALINHSHSQYENKGSPTYYGTTSTAAGTQVKEVSVSDTGFSLEEGVVLVLKSTTAQTFNASSTNPVKLSVNGGTQVNVQYINGNYSTRYMWSANEVVELVYDGTNWILLDNGLATTTYYGVTKLINSVTSTSNALAATANSVKTAYDLANGKADDVHTHAISDVTNLQTTLDGKASSSHTHTISQLSNASTVAVTVTYTDSTTETITFLKQS